MRGTRPLSNAEIVLISDCFEGRYSVRDRSLILIGVSTGGRISELLSLRIGDVYQNGKAVSTLLYEKQMVKGNEHARAVPVNSDGIAAIEALIGWHESSFGGVDPRRVLFVSRKSGGGFCAIGRQQAHRILKSACAKAALNGKLATHSLRKSYAQRLYAQINDIFCVKEMLGHQSVATTQAYISVNYGKTHAASEAMSLTEHLKSQNRR